MADRRTCASSILFGTLVLAVTAPAAAQDDVVRLGERYGTTPPASYFELRSARPDAFEWDRAWFDRNPELEVVDRGPDARPEVRRATGPRLLRDGGAASAASEAHAVDGTLAFPLLPGLYSDDGLSPFAREVLDQQFFSGPNPGGTIPEFYREISGGRLELVGETFDWRRVQLTRAQVTGGVSGLGGASRVGEFILQLLSAWDDGTVDWGRYDNDGPDGIPNSGDDDGYVDVITVLHSTFGGECGSAGQEDRIWSHRWSLRSAVGQSYVTRTDAANGGRIRVSDYTIQPAFSCGGGTINSIGVLAHELGHGLGLPDLYAVNDGVSSPHQGIGTWGLMGSGAWGCADTDPARPCHMSAWSKERLGWLDVVDVEPETDLGTVTLPPVETTGRVLRVPIPGTASGPDTGEYYLIENRQPVGYDSDLRAPGVLVWHIDDGIIAEKRRRNQVNSDPDAMGVRLVEADGRGDLRSRFGNRSDDGDAFPGSSSRTEFHAGTDPAARDNSGRAARLTLTDLRPAGTDAVFDLDTRTRGLVVRTEGTDLPGLVSVSGVEPEADGSFRVTPFDGIDVTAAPGASIAEGVRRRFEGWGDGTEARVRRVEVGNEDLELTARYGTEEVEVQVETSGESYGVAPGRVVSTPASEDLWFERGASVRLEAVPTPGFEFVSWTGIPQASGSSLDLVLDEPIQLGAAFRFTWEFESPAEVALAAGSDTEVVLAVGTATDPITWSMAGGSLPEGMGFEEDGRLVGVPLELGSWSFFVRARDALGLELLRQMQVEVARPEFDIELLSAPLVLSGAGPASGQLLWLDRQGNANGAYDIGDLRAYLRGSTGASTLPAAAEVRIRIDLTRRTGGER